MHNAYTARTQRVHRMVCAVLACMASVLTQPTAAQSIALPTGCEGWLTLQQRSCQVVNYYRCEVDAPGNFWMQVNDSDGLYLTMHIGPEYEWLEVHAPRVGYSDILEQPEADPTRITELLSEGVDTREFVTVTNLGNRRTVRGRQWMTGEKVVVDGVPLLRTSYDTQALFEDGTIAWHSRGAEYVHVGWNMLIAGTEEWRAGDGDWQHRNLEPMEFIFPGEAGFLSGKPRYDCGAVQARAPGETDLRETERNVVDVF